MDPFKIIGGLLILLGLAFRAITLAYFRLHSRSLAEDTPARLRLERKQRRALLWDYAFIVAGIYTLVTH